MSIEDAVIKLIEESEAKPDLASVVNWFIKLSKARTSLQTWIDKQGHNKCHYYPEIFRELCDLLEVKQSVPDELPPESEFAAGCEKYKQEIYNYDTQLIATRMYNRPIYCSKNHPLVCKAIVVGCSEKGMVLIKDKVGNTYETNIPIGDYLKKNGKIGYEEFVEFYTTDDEAVFVRILYQEH